MSFLDIVGTPVQIGLNFVRVGDSPPPSPHPLGGPAGTILRAALLAQLSPADQAAFNMLLSTPLDETFDNAWGNLQASTQGLVQQAVTSFQPTAYDFNVSLPPKGTLRAQVGNLSPGLFAQFPWAVSASQLTLSYLLPGVVVTFKIRNHSPFGTSLDLKIVLLFDGEVGVYVAVPKYPKVPLQFAQEFLTNNMRFGPGNFIARLAFGLQDIKNFLNNQPIPDRNLPDQSTGISTTIGSLGDLSNGFAAGVPFGFLQLGVQINPNALTGAPAGNTVEFDLTHPFDPGPVVSNAAGSGPSLFSPQIVVSAPQVNAGSSVLVTGSLFPATQPDQLTITWTDTTSADVVQSEVQWGQVPNGGPIPPGTAPAGAKDLMIPRSGPRDNANTFTATPLMPNTSYAFRVRDYDVYVAGFLSIATDWSAWTVLTTAPSNQVELALDDGSNTVIGYATLQSDGSFVTTVKIPALEPPGTYALWAVLSGQRMASATLTVVAEGQALPALLQVLNPLNLSPFPTSAIVEGGTEVLVSGSNFPPGTAELFLDSVGGMVLASDGPHLTGSFMFPFKWPLGVIGPHNIVAEQGASQASAPVYAENPAS